MIIPRSRLLSFAILIALTRIGYPQASLDQAWTVLQAGLSDKNTESRAAAVRLLGLLPEEQKAPQFALEALKDEKPEVREAATDALGRLKAKSAIPQLTEVIQHDKEAPVVLGAARALIAMDDSLGYGVFYAVLTGEKKSGGGLMEDQKKMLKDPQKLAQFGFEQGVGFVPFGGLGLTVVRSLTKDDVSPIRAAAARILAADPDPKSLAALEAACRDNSWQVQVAALAAIAQRGDPGTRSTVEMYLDNPKEIVRYTAAAALIHLNDLPTRKPIRNSTQKKRQAK